MSDVSAAEPMPVSRIALVAARLARWCAMRPKRVVACALIVLALSVLSLSHLRVSSSLSVMLGTDSETAAAMERVATDYRSGDALLLLVELPEGRAADTAGRAELVGFAAKLQEAIASEPTASSRIAWVRFREDPELLRFVRERMLPSGVFYLTDEGATELRKRIEPAWIREQIARNEAMIRAPGPAGVTLSQNVLRDPLRLLELIPPELRPGDGPPGMADAGPGKPEFSRDGRALLVHIGAKQTGNDYTEAGRLVDDVVRLAAALNTSGLRIEPAGAAAIARESSRVIRHDSIVSALASIFMLYLLFLAFYRRWTAGLVVSGVAAVGMAAGIGIVALVIKEVSPLATMIAALLAGLGTDYGVHFLSHYADYRARGIGSVQASTETARHMGVPILTNCFTSIFGFISLWPSQIRMLSDFAIMGAAGLIGALLAIFTLMPAALAVMDRRAITKTGEHAQVGRLVDAVAAKPRRYMASSLAIMGVTVVAAAIQGFSLEFEPDLTVMHPRPNRSLHATDEVIRRFASQGDVVPIEISAATPEALISTAHATARALTTPECRSIGVTSVIGLHSLLPDPRTSEDRRRLLEEIDADSVLTAFDAAIAASDFDPAAYTGYEKFLRTLLSSRHAPSIDDVLGFDRLAERLFPASTLAAGAPPTKTVLIIRLADPLRERTQRRAAVDVLTRAAADVQPGKATLASIAAVSVELDEATRAGLPRSFAISFILVVTWLLLVFRKPADVMLALIPLLFAAGTTVLFIIATGQKFNPINSVAVPLLDGIAVDAGVFLVSAYRLHGSTSGRLLGDLRSTTHAVLLSVSTTVTAFLALCISHIPAVQSLGLVSAIGILASGIGALLLLMPLLLWRASKVYP